jgi:hypothetical protein
LKTELDTAVFLSERLVKPSSVPDAAADCARERPDTYRPLCENLPGASVRQLLWLKAGLHVRWAEALVRRYRGASDAETSNLLTSLAAARLSDLEVAGRALQSCARTRTLLSAHPLFGGHRVSGLKGSVTVGEAARALSEARRLASTLPRSLLWYRMSNAISAYEDGLYWLARLEQAKSRVVSAQGSAEITLRKLGIPDVVADATVRGNFRQAEAYSNASGDLLRQLRSRYHACGL